MPVTVVSESPLGETIVAETANPEPSFSWSAVFAGAFVAVAVTFFLLTLGSGVGLSLVGVRHATTDGAVTFLTLGAIYFLAAQAFGFAAGGHITGRLIGPAIETTREEDFRAGAHGLVVWALAVVVTVSAVALSALAIGTTNNAVTGALASAASGSPAGDQPALTAYWVDKLFRPPLPGTQASLAWKQYAQADTGTTTDGGPAPQTPDQSTILSPSDSQPPVTAAPRSSGVMLGSPTSAPIAGTEAARPGYRSLGADKAEAGRILSVGMTNGELLSDDDRIQLTGLVATDTGLTVGAARHRVDYVAGRIHDRLTDAAETARKTAAYAGLWTALALLFGAVVAAFATISARWEDDRERGTVPGAAAPRTAA